MGTSLRSTGQTKKTWFQHEFLIPVDRLPYPVIRYMPDGFVALVLNMVRNLAGIRDWNDCRRNVCQPAKQAVMGFTPI